MVEILNEYLKLDLDSKKPITYLKIPILSFIMSFTANSIIKLIQLIN